MTLRDRKIDREIADSVRLAHFIVRSPMPDEPTVEVCLYVTPDYPPSSEVFALRSESPASALEARNLRD